VGLAGLELEVVGAVVVGVVVVGAGEVLVDDGTLLVLPVVTVGPDVGVVAS
jgi:hypothetical protein